MQLKNLGLYLSIDDFCTDCSSLAYLQKLPVDCLKIDRSFLPDASQIQAGATPEAALLHGIVVLAQRAGLGTVVEGIETEEQLRFVQRSGADEGQGFLLARPMPAAALRHHLAGNQAR